MWTRPVLLTLLHGVSGDHARLQRGRLIIQEGISYLGGTDGLIGFVGRQNILLSILQERQVVLSQSKVR